MAGSRLGASDPGEARSASTVSVMRTTTRTPPPAASTRVSALSRGVATLKWDGTPRHTCSDTIAVSVTQAVANVASSQVRVRSRSGSSAAIHVTVTSVSPNDSPNVTALRHDTGPSQGPPATAYTARWNSPDANSRAPTRYPARSTGPPWTQ